MNISSLGVNWKRSKKKKDVAGKEKEGKRYRENIS